MVVGSETRVTANLLKKLASNEIKNGLKVIFIFSMITDKLASEHTLHYFGHDSISSPAIGPFFSMLI